MIKPSQSDPKHDFQQYTDKATVLIHAPETRDAVMNLLKPDNPVQCVANATVMIMQRLDSAARAAGIEVQDSIKCFGANSVVRLIVEVGEAGQRFGAFKFDEAHIELALSTAVQDYVKSEVQAGRIDPQRLKVAMDADIRKMPPRQRKEIQSAQIRIQQTARKYNGGQQAQPVQE